MDRCVKAGLGLAALGATLLGSAPAEAYTVYVSNEKGNSVSVIDTATMAVTGTWKVGRRPRGITVSRDGKEVFVCASDDDRIDVLDAATGKVVRSLRSGPDPEQFILDRSGNPLYVANEGKLAAVVAPEVADAVLAKLRAHPLGRDAAVVGEVVTDPPGMVRLDTAFGGSRVVDMLAGDPLPRIC